MGSFGQVIEGQHSGDHTRVAIKMYKEISQESIHSIETEIKALKKLKGQNNILEIFACG